MKFSKLHYAGQYQATRNDGQVITIEKRDGIWLTTYENDLNGDNTNESKTLSKAKNFENIIEVRASLIAPFALTGNIEKTLSEG